jgi:2-methylcitrate dehydratase PrpD
VSSFTGSSAIHRMGEFTHSLRLDAVPADVRRQAALSLLDTIGCIVAGSETSDAGALLAAEGADAEGQSTVVGHARRLSPRAPARCNGYLGDIFELNDLTGGDASIATVAAAMTAAEISDASGRVCLRRRQLGSRRPPGSTTPCTPHSRAATKAACRRSRSRTR